MEVQKSSLGTAYSVCVCVCDFKDFPLGPRTLRTTGCLPSCAYRENIIWAIFIYLLNKSKSNKKRSPFIETYRKVSGQVKVCFH